MVSSEEVISKDNLDRYYKKIVASIQLLALDNDARGKYFPDFVDKNFEALDNFEKSFSLCPCLIENNYFSNKNIAWILRLKNVVEYKIDNYNNNEHIDCNSGNIYQDNIINLAKIVLKHIGEHEDPPDANYI